MPVSRVGEKARRSAPGHDAAWYEQQRHDNEKRNMSLFNSVGWYYCDPDSFYRSLFPEGTLQKRGDDSDGKPNLIVLEDTGEELPAGTDDKGNELTKRVMKRYTVHDDLDDLEELRKKSIRENTFMFLAPVSYYGKSRSSRNARYLHAIMIDLDYVGEQQLANLLHQMNRKVIPQANYLVSSGTGLHVVYKLDRPVPLMTRYVAGLQALKRELTDRVWNAHTSASDPDKKQVQGIFQSFRMVGSATKLNGAIGNPKYEKPYEVVCFSHDETPPATIPYLLSFIPNLRDKQEMASLDALQSLTQEARSTTPAAEAKERWPEWYERHVVNGEPRGGWTFGRAAYDQVLDVIRKGASVSHRYWCIFYLAVMANKCGVPYEELEDDAYGLLERFDSLSTEPGNRFTANDVAAALEAFEGGSASGLARRYTQAFCERKAAVEYGEKLGHGSNPPEKRLPKDLSLEKARAWRDVNQKAKGAHWWDGGNRSGAPKKAMQVWKAASDNPGSSVAALAREAGVSRPTVYKWLKPGWQAEYAAALDEERNPIPEAAGMRAHRVKAELVSDGPSRFEYAVVSHVASHPWEPANHTAAFFELSSERTLERMLDENRDLLNQMRLGTEERRRAWGFETDDYYDALTAARITGTMDGLMAARQDGVQASIRWAREKLPDVFSRLQEIRAQGRKPTVEELLELKETYIHSI
jgi:hypothetical protein